MSWPIFLKAVGLIGVAVGGDHVLTDTPGRLDLDVGIGGEQIL